jgi:hypothetical protein
MPVTLPPSRIRILLDELIRLKRIGHEEGRSKKWAGVGDRTTEEAEG